MLFIGCGPFLEGDLVELWVMLLCGCLEQETMQDALWGHLCPTNHKLGGGWNF